jgi:glutamate dehydrogenase/leucine dehydrogenase
VIACGANVPFADAQIFIGPIADATDDQTSVIPDFIANCGMARVFAYLMSEQASAPNGMSDEAIFEDVSEVIRKALMRVQSFNPKTTGIAKKGLELSLNTLV